ncbi:MAG: signal peptide peptidase SppA [Bacteroidales bacterium]|nr:signal peptide peptidase SppA [Bacteroidales bacterium]
MNDFLKYTLASLLGVVLAGILSVVMSLLVLAGVAASGESEVTIRENSILMLNLDGELAERAENIPFSKFLSNGIETYGLDDILNSIRKAKENDHIRGIYLQPKSFSASFASLEAIRRALLDFKESGKFVVAYADHYTQGMYYLASVADKLIANPQGSIYWHGMAGQVIYFKNLLEKLGVEMQVFKVGTYKSAVEPFIATEMSDANREQITAYLTSIWNQLCADISVSRSIPVDSLNALAEAMQDVQPAESYVNTGLVDTLLYKDGVRDYLKQLTDSDEDQSLRTVSVSEMKNVRRNVPKDKSGNVLAVYYAFGEIVDEPSQYAAFEKNIVLENTIKDLRALRDDESIKAVVLRVNSPGGSAYASEQIWNEVVKLKEKKPVVVSMGDYAASGGYYISCAADAIVAEATTLTGSIGIFGTFPCAEKLLHDKLGLHVSVVKTHKFADLGDYTHAMNNDERELLQGYINRGYELFTRRCAEGRNMDIDSLRQIAEGRVWTGTTAKKLGLVDEIGGLEKALEIAAEKAAMESYSVVDYPENETNWLQLLDERKTDYINGSLKQLLGDHAECFWYLKNIGSMSRVQARLPFVIALH